MRTPRIFLCYAPRAGLRCALAYLAGERDAYGWFTGARDAEVCSAYFVLEDFYTPRETRYVSIPDADLHSSWTSDEARCHELAQLQDGFVREWLFYRADDSAYADQEAYAQAELAIGDVNVRFRRLNRFSRLQPNWTYYSHDFEHRVLAFLARRWMLDYRPEFEEPIATLRS